MQSLHSLEIIGIEFSQQGQLLHMHTKTGARTGSLWEFRSQKLHIVLFFE